MTGSPTRALGRRAAVAAGVAGALVAAAGVGRAVAGPPSAPVVLPAPTCPRVLAEALPRVGPSSDDLVPWGPITARVCTYRTSSGSDAGRAAAGASTVLDATATAELAGLLHPLADAPPDCAEIATRPDAAAASGETVAVVLFRYRPGRTPTTGAVLRVVLRSVPCTTASDVTRTVTVTPDVARRLADLVPVLRTTFPDR